MKRTLGLTLALTGLVLAGCEPAEEAGEQEASGGVERVEQGNLVYENIPPIPASLEQRLQQYQNTRSARVSNWTPDGSLLINTRFGETSQLHEVNEPLGMRRQLTFFDEPVYDANHAPADSPHDGFLFMRDEGGDENYQIFFFERPGGDVRLLTDGETRNENPIWNNAGDAFAFRSNRRNGTDWDIWLRNPEEDEPEMVYEGEGYWLPAAFSPDDSRLAIMKYVSVTNTTLAVLDLETGKTEEIRVAEEPAYYAPVDFTADGSGLYLISDAGSEFNILRRYDFDSGEFTELTGDTGWNVEAADLSSDRERMAYVVNEGGLSTLHIRQTDGWQAEPAPNLPSGMINSIEFSPGGDRLAFTLARPTSPSDVYVYDLESLELTRWTESEVGGLNRDGFIAPELISFQSFDGLDVPAFVYRPESEGPHPVVIQIHGGPESQYRPYYSSTIQYLLREMGVAVIAPNVRGSSGYGKTYVEMDNQRKREDSVRDIGALLDWIAEQPGLDQDRVVVYGGSYGGYMVLASMVHFDDRLRGGIDVVGISNFVTFLENTEDYRKDVRRPEYGDERDPEIREFLESISPLNHVDKINKPLFVIQGENDPRVPVTESEQMVREIREHGGEVWYLLARDEGHGFRKKSNRDFQTAVMMLFLQDLFFKSE